MFKSQKVLLILLLFIASFPSAASSKALPSAKPPIFMNFCEDAHTPADQQACTQERYENAELILQKQFNQFLQFLRGSSHAHNIKSAQNAWIDYRNQQCEFESGFFEEAIAQRTLELSCLSRLTEERALIIYNFIPRTRAQIQKHESN